jgi:hypothetical protein
MQGDERFLAAGCDGYVAKPIERRALRRDRVGAPGHEERRASSLSTISPRT